MQLYVGRQDWPQKPPVPASDRPRCRPANRPARMPVRRVGLRAIPGAAPWVDLPCPASTAPSVDSASTVTTANTRAMPVTPPAVPPSNCSSTSSGTGDDAHPALAGRSYRRRQHDPRHPLGGLRKQYPDPWETILLDRAAMEEDQ